MFDRYAISDQADLDDAVKKLERKPSEGTLTKKEKMIMPDDKITDQILAEARLIPHAVGGDWEQEQEEVAKWANEHPESELYKHLEWYLDMRRQAHKLLTEHREKSA